MHLTREETKDWRVDDYSRMRIIEEVSREGVQLVSDANGLRS